jgi:hypothetical protein
MIAESTFNTSDEGWVVTPDGIGPTYQSTGGNPGGYISAIDEVLGETWYWEAPAKFLGDVSAVYGGILSFDLNQALIDSQKDRDDVILIGSGITLVYNTTDNPYATWTSYSVVLHESAGWTNLATSLPATSSDLTQVLSDLSTLRIRGDFRIGEDSSSLDNVKLSPICPALQDLVVTSDVTCWLPVGTLTYNSITVLSGGTIIAEGDSSIPQGVTVHAASITVENGGIITADGQGYDSANGPGAGQDDPTWWTGGGGGGGFGGYGSAGQDGGSGGMPYGNAFEPDDLGSGGGNNTYQSIPGGAGGGAIKIVVSGTLHVDGSISAFGGNGSKDGAGNAVGGGGSGGSIWIQTGTLSGTGTIDASGGNGGSGANKGGGGAGGRIALDYTTYSYSGSTNAYGGTGYQYGGPGTIYFAPQDRLLVDNNGHNSLAAGLTESTYNIASIELLNSGHLEVIGTNSSLTLDNGVVSGDGTASLSAFGTINAPADFNIGGYDLLVEGILSGTDSFTLTADGGLRLRSYTPLYTGAFNFGTIDIQSGGELTLIPYDNGDADFTNEAPFELNSVSITVTSGGSINSNAAGYPSSTGPGEGQDDPTWWTGGGGGGGFGGYGSVGQDGGSGGMPYGNAFEPDDLGSGGGNNPHASIPGGAGGGAITIVVSGTLHVDGSISARGGNGSKDGAGNAVGGGGSGGSIWIQTGTLSGVGTIDASGGNGGSGANKGGGGSGGRIALDYTTYSYSGSTNAYGGIGYRYGGPGTIYFAPQDRLLVDNNGHNSLAAGLTEGAYNIASIELLNSGHLEVIGTNSSLTLDNGTVSGDGTAALTGFGEISVPALFSIDGYTLDAAGKLNNATDITIGSNSGLILRAYTPLYTGIHNFNSLVVESTGKLTLVPFDNGDTDYTNDAPFELVVNWSYPGLVDS